LKLTTITVSYGETASLPDYSNTKPHITYTAELGPDDDPAQIESALWQQAQDAVRARIDDALELHGKPAMYDPAPRCQVIKSKTWYRYNIPAGMIAPPYESIIAILPDEIARPDGYFHTYNESRNLRYMHALRIAARVSAEDGARLIDCADGDLSRIPSMALIAAPPLAVPETPEEEAEAD